MKNHQSILNKCFLKTEDPMHYFLEVKVDVATECCLNSQFASKQHYCIIVRQLI